MGGTVLVSCQHGAGVFQGDAIGGWAQCWFPVRGCWQLGTVLVSSKEMLLAAAAGAISSCGQSHALSVGLSCWLPEGLPGHQHLVSRLRTRWSECLLGPDL